MAKTVLLNTRVFAGGADLTGVSNKIELSAEIDEQNVTSFGSNGWTESLGGLGSTEITGGGQWEAGDPGRVDNETWSTLSGRTLQPWTVCPLSASVGDLAYATDALRTTYTQGGEVGNVAPWDASAAGVSPLLRGTVAHPPGTARTVSGEGTGLELGSVGDGQRIYAVLHVLSVSGTSPSLTVEVESDIDNTWTAPTTQLSFDPATAPGGQVASAAGPITDTWWRVVWDITGTSPSFLFVATLAIA